MHNEDELYRLLSERITRRQFVRGVAASAGFITLNSILAACGAPAPPPTTGAQPSPDSLEPIVGGTLNVAQTTLADSLDPGTAGGWSSWKVYDNIFNKLINLDENGEFVPELATSWQLVDDVTWEFDLVTNAVFHNGEKFTAGDVKYTFERILSPETQSTWVGLFRSIESVETSGDYQVRFKMREPYAPFLNNLAIRGEIVNEKAIADNDPTREPVGTGPFVFREWISQDHITLDRWDQYFKEGKPYLDQVIIRDYPVDTTRIVGLELDEIQWADAVPLSEVERLKTSDIIKLVTSARGALGDHIALNVEKPPLDQKEVRQALAWAIDAQGMTDAAFFGQGEVATGLFPQTSPWYSASIEETYPGAPDLEKARQLLAEAGYPEGNFEIEVLSLTQFAELARMAEVLRDQLRPLGITVSIAQRELVAWQQEVFFNKTYTSTTTYYETGPDPDSYLGQMFHSEESRNYLRYGNPRVDELLERSRVTLDVEERRAIIAEASKIIVEDAPAIFVHFTYLIWAMRKEVMGSKVYPPKDIRYEEFWFAT